MNKVNEIVFTDDPYDHDLDAMWADIGKTLHVLIKLGYQASVRDDDCNIIVIQFESDNPEFGTPRIRWLNDDQYYSFMSYIEGDYAEDD